MNKLKYHFLGGLVFLGTIVFGYIGYTAYTNLATQVDGATITQTIWNDVIKTINDIGTKTDTLETKTSNIYQSGTNIGIGTSNPTAKLDINGNVKISGILTNSQQPYFNAYNPSVTTQGNTIIFTATRDNIGNYYNISDGTFTAPITGVYHFDVSILMKACSGGSNYIRILWKINGVKSTNYGDSLTNAISSNYDSVNMGITIKLNAGDTLAVQNDGPIETYGQGYGQFSGFLIY